MRAIFIRFLFLLILIHPVLSRATKAPNKNILQREIDANKLTFKQQVFHLLWIEELDNTSGFGGLITNNPETISAENNNSSSYSILNVYKGVEAYSKSPIPFPSFAIRKEFSETAYAFS